MRRDPLFLFLTMIISRFLIILVIGLSGIVAQVLLLRELLVSFHGNELTLGIILANWVLQEALGVFIIGRYIDRTKDKINLLVILEFLFSLTLPFSIYLARTFNNLIGIPRGEWIGLPLILVISFFIILPVSFIHGALFSTCCKVWPDKEEASWIGRVYAFETIGTILGGIILTFLFIPYLTSFSAALIIALLNLTVCFLPRFLLKPKFKFIFAGVILFIIYLFTSGTLNNIERISVNRQWEGLRVLDYQNSIYGNVVVTKEKEQYTFFYNGLPIIVSPFPNTQFVEEFGHLPLLSTFLPKNILVVGAGAGGLIREILKHPIEKLDYVELDPLIIKMVAKFPTKLTELELNDRRVKIINQDGRFFLQVNPRLYDVILIGLSNQADLSTNRLFTLEFFSLAKKRLNPEGVLALWLPGSLTFLSQEIKDLNECILDSLQESFKFIRVIPGDYNIFLASDSKGIMEITPHLISERISQQRIKTNLLIRSYLNYRLDKSWVDWFMQNLKSARRKVNHDLKPQAVFEALKFSHKRFSKSLMPIFISLEKLSLRSVIIFISFLTLLLFYPFSYFKKRKLAIAYSIATTGFFGMLSTVILIFSFQVFFGYLYYQIGLLMSFFMAGSALGSIFIATLIKKAKKLLNLFVFFELGIIVFSYLMALNLIASAKSQDYSLISFILLFSLSGFLVGAEFTLAGKIYLGRGQGVGNTAGILYASDLLGGWLAGVVGSIILLPLLGVFQSCMIIIIFKCSSLFLLYGTKRNFS